MSELPAPQKRGRADLNDWRDAQPSNFFLEDRLLRALMKAGRLNRYTADLTRFGEEAAGPLNEAAIRSNEKENLPRVERWDGLGNRIEAVRHHPSYHDCGRFIYGSGVMAAYGDTPIPHRFILSLFYLSTHAGEAGHNCPLACTAGAIRSIQELGTDAQRERWLPKLLNPIYGEHYAGAQFLTEVQGGSDVGLNALRAEPTGDGRYRLYGQKWFCSSADADVFVVTARPTDRDDGGTAGLSLFLVARTEDSRPNGFALHRLKEKIGTRSMATGEIVFEGALAEPLGAMDRGIQNVMALVINTSRLYNAFGCAGLAHRAFLIANTYAAHRRAFGQPIGNYPLVSETLAWIQADAEACLAGSFWLAEIQEKIDNDTATENEMAFFRLGVNLNKYRTAVLAHDAINRALEVLAGNGTVETFSVLPRLLRDNVVFENWEGAHNVLRRQVFNDCLRYNLHHGFLKMLRLRLGSERVAPTEALLSVCLKTQDTLLLRPVCDQLASLLHLAALQPISDPAIEARAALSAWRHLDGGEVNEAYRELLKSARSDHDGGSAA